MTAGKAIRMLVSGLAGAVVLLSGSMLHLLATGHYWLLVIVSFGGASGLIIGYLLTKAQERTSELEKQMEDCNADLRKSIQDYQLLTEEHESHRKVESQERRRRAQELSLVGEMAARLSHEIKNPLGSIWVGVKIGRAHV